MVRVHSPTQAAKKGFILDGNPLHAQPTISFRESDGVPPKRVHSLFSISSTPDEILLGSINQLVHGARKLNVLHNMVGDAS